ncbi:MAG: dual specificity protein phosphatase family protein [Anaerolineae bacterium]|nr:dual specificity protein phosphatase family protein [Anaerolineae bacterium]
MHKIRHWLYVGKYRETADLNTLVAYRISAMLQLADKAEQPGIESLYVPVEDGEPLPVDKLRQGVDFVRAQKAAGKTVLVACGAGISRSVTFTMAVLKEEEGLTLVDALREIQKTHPDALPHDKLVYSVCQYYGESTWPPAW